jgi:hypothetical protein
MSARSKDGSTKLKKMAEFLNFSLRVEPGPIAIGLRVNPFKKPLEPDLKFSLCRICDSLLQIA